jgi:multicomponent Na+:H+ antiporter subunit E
MSNRTWPVFGALLALLWLFVRGVALRPQPIVKELVLGLALGLPVAFGLRRLYTDRTDVGRSLRASPYALLYLLTFLFEVLTANIDVARRVLSPRLPIEPDVLVIPLRVETDLAITTIANSITLTPGTLTMDYDESRNALFVHAIDASDREAVVEPIRTWESYALVIFDEEGQPGDPIPDLEGDDEDE